jgi:hypothetical protein
MGTREHLHRVAEHVVSPARYAVTGRIGLRPAPGGFATPPFGDDQRVVAVDGGELVVRVGRRERRTPLTTLRAAADFVGVAPGAPAQVYEPATPLALDEPLDIDAEAVLALGRWYAFAERALQRFAAEIAEDNPSEAQLWPEHLDLAISAAGVNYGASPGDDAYPDPYLYVGPHEAPPNDEFWNAPFGAVRASRQVRSIDEAVAFFAEGRRRTRSTR